MAPITAKEKGCQEGRAKAPRRGALPLVVWELANEITGVRRVWSTVGV